MGSLDPEAPDTDIGVASILLRERNREVGGVRELLGCPNPGTLTEELRPSVAREGVWSSELCKSLAEDEASVAGLVPPAEGIVKGSGGPETAGRTVDGTGCDVELSTVGSVE